MKRKGRRGLGEKGRRRRQGNKNEGKQWNGKERNIMIRVSLLNNCQLSKQQTELRGRVGGVRMICSRKFEQN